MRVFTFLRCLVSQVIHLGFKEALFLFSFPDRWRAARPQRATSGGRWPINIDLFTMAGLMAWRSSFFPFSFSALSTQLINCALWKWVQSVFTVVPVLEVFGCHINRTHSVMLALARTRAARDSHLRFFFCFRTSCLIKSSFWKQNS